VPVEGVGEVTFRPMRDEDLPMLQAWIGRPHVREWWAGEEADMPFEEFRAHYLPRVMAEENVTPYIVTLDGRPIGFAQSYVAMGSGDGWWENVADPGVRGIDQFLCEVSDLGKGLGTRMVKAFVAQLFADPAVTRLQTDPDPRNARAIRCYEKAGFRAVDTIVTPDGPALYMVQDRAG
jgi:AacA4 family aminoglycoside N(6')-acetyltransferase